ncbi:shikimate kinase [Gracilimonas sp.]|uniref:shikimate kinase n=1 Tax=Gracilimonas sp. TaxID=1974203 RepID=UPI0028719A6A|nr:shikimate kinase [Gracilimonas sp.]
MNTNRLNNFKGSIYICGFMASGKSTLGKKLAQKLDWEFRDLDTVIEEKENKVIKDIFEDRGEEYFREKEWEYLLELSRDFKGIVSLGGGALQNQQVVDHLKVNGILLFLEVPLKEITKRVARRNHRPILFDEEGEIKSREQLFEELKALYSDREKYYKQAEINIHSSEYNSIKEMADIAIDKIKRHV